MDVGSAARPSLFSVFSSFSCLLSFFSSSASDTARWAAAFSRHRGLSLLSSRTTLASSGGRRAMQGSPRRSKWSATKRGSCALSLSLWNRARNGAFFQGVRHEAATQRRCSASVSFVVAPRYTQTVGVYSHHIRLHDTPLAPCPAAQIRVLGYLDGRRCEKRQRLGAVGKRRRPVGHGGGAGQNDNRLVFDAARTADAALWHKGPMLEVMHWDRRSSEAQCSLFFSAETAKGIRRQASVLEETRSAKEISGNINCITNKKDIENTENIETGDQVQCILKRGALQEASLTAHAHAISWWVGPHREAFSPDN